MSKREGFNHSLMILILLTDASDGSAVEHGKTLFYKDAIPLAFLRKGNGLYGISNLERVDFTLTAVVPGYIKKSIRVGTEDLNSAPVCRELCLVPEPFPENTAMDVDASEMYVWEGRKEGLQAIDGVSLERGDVQLQSFDQGTNTLTLFNPRKLYLVHSRYALVDGRQQRFEPFEVIEQSDTIRVRIKEALRTKELTGASVMRLIEGDVRKDGHFLFLAKSHGKTAGFLIRTLTKSGETFQRMGEMKSS